MFKKNVYARKNNIKNYYRMLTTTVFEYYECFNRPIGSLTNLLNFLHNNKIKTARGNNDNPTNKGAKYDTSTESEYEGNYCQNKFFEVFVK